MHLNKKMFACKFTEYSDSNSASPSDDVTSGRTAYVTALASDEAITKIEKLLEEAYSGNISHYTEGKEVEFQGNYTSCREKHFWRVTCTLEEIKETTRL